MNIYEKLAAITAELKAIQKNLIVKPTKTSSYKAVSERDILDAVKPLEEKYKVYSYPVSREVLESNLIDNTTEFKDGDKTTTTKKTSFMTRIKTVYRFVNIEKPDEYIETTTFSEGIDAQDKGSGKAMTYADKYALMKTYKISTGDDPDGVTDDLAIHNAYKIKQRIEELMTAKMQKGLSIAEIAKAAGLTEKHLSQYLAALPVIASMEAKIEKL